MISSSFRGLELPLPQRSTLLRHLDRVIPG
jgi:hypothetical protein